MNNFKFRFWLEDLKNCNFNLQFFLGKLINTEKSTFVPGILFTKTPFEQKLTKYTYIFKKCFLLSQKYIVVRGDKNKRPTPFYFENNCY